MSFIVGVLVGLVLSSKSSTRNRGGISLEPVGSHASNPFKAPPAPDDVKQVPDDAEVIIQTKD